MENISEFCTCGNLNYPLHFGKIYGLVTINWTDFLRLYQVSKGVAVMTEMKRKRKPRKHTDEFKQQPAYLYF